MKYSNIIAWLLALFIAGIAMILSGGILIFINIPSIIIVFGISYFIGIASYGWNDFNSSIKALTFVYKKEVSPWVEIKHLNIIKNTRIFIILSGLIGVFVGLIGMLANIDDPKAIGPSLAVVLLTVLYSIFLIIFLYQPALVFLENYFDNTAKE